MTNLNDYHAFKSTTDGGAGCAGGCLACAAVVIGVVCIVGVLFG